MIELKEYLFCKSDEFFTEEYVCPYYLKSEADKVISEMDAEIQKWKAARDECERQFQEKVDEIAVLLDKLIEEQSKVARHKYKRCLDKAEICDSKIIYYGKLIGEVVNLDLENERRVKVFKRFNFYKRWYRRWRELAEKFKEGK